MFIEFQFSTQLFATIVRNRIVAMDLCPDAAADLVIDRIVPRATLVQRETRLEEISGIRTEVPSSTEVVWVFSPKNYYSFTTRHLQIVQEFDVFLVSEDELASNGVAASDSQPTPIRAAFNVALNPTNQTQGGGPALLSYTFAWAHFGILDPFLPVAKRSKLEALVASTKLPSTPLDLGALEGLTGSPMQAVNAAIALGSDAKAVVLRVDIEVVQTPPRIGVGFFEWDAPNLLNGQDWAVVLDKDILTATASKRVAEGLASQSGLRQKWGPEVSWEPDGPRLVVQAGVEILGACPFFIDDIDLDVDLEVKTEFALKSPTQLAVHFHIEGEASDTAEIIGCSVVPALLWPIAGPLILDELKSDSVVGDYFAGLLLGLPAIAMTFAAAVGTMSAKSLEANQFGATCTKVDDSDVECTYPLLLNVGDPALPIKLRGQLVKGTPLGLVLCGPAQVAQIHYEVISVTTTPLEWTISGGCRRGFRFVVQAQIQIHSSGLRGGVCSARMLDDPLEEFTLSVDRAANMVTVGARGTPAYAALTNKYPCKVRVVTTGGVRTITYPPPAPISPERQQQLEKLRHNFDRVCQAWKDTFHEIEWGGWKPLGPTDGPDWLQHWEVAVHELEPGEWLDVSTSTGERVLSARASAHGVVHFGAVFDGPRGPEALRMARRSEGPFRVAPIITPLQMVLAHRRTIDVAGDIVSVQFEGTGGKRRLTIVGSEATQRFALAGRSIASSIESADLADPAVLSDGAVGAGEVNARGLKMLMAPGAKDLTAATTLNLRVGGVVAPTFAKSEGGASLYELGRSQEPQLVQEYFGRAWFEDTALGGSWVARWGEATSEVRLYQVIARRTESDVPRRLDEISCDEDELTDESTPSAE
jgi:hypothetical protein